MSDYICVQRGDQLVPVLCPHCGKPILYWRGVWRGGRTVHRACAAPLTGQPSAATAGSVLLCAFELWSRFGARHQEAIRRAADRAGTDVSQWMVDTLLRSAGCGPHPQRMAPA